MGVIYREGKYKGREEDKREKGKKGESVEGKDYKGIRERREKERIKWEERRDDIKREGRMKGRAKRERKK